MVCCSLGWAATDRLRRHHAGQIEDSWAGLGSGLAVLQVGNNSLAGSQLPGSWGAAWPNLVVLWMTATNLTSTFPPEWGASGAFPSLTDVRLHHNPNLTGTQVSRAVQAPRC